MSLEHTGPEEGNLPPESIVPTDADPEAILDTPDTDPVHSAVDQEGHPVSPEGGKISAREAYAKALRSQSKVFFGRASTKELEERRVEYHGWISVEIQKEIEEIKKEFGEIQSDPAREAELNAKITELVLTNQAEEENALMMSMEDPTQVTAIQKFQKFWKKNAKTRLIVGAALLGGVAVSTLTGQFGIAAGLQTLRTPMSGVGGTMTIESLADIVRNKYGGTKEITDDDVASMEQDELLRRLAAHETSFTDTGTGEFGVKTRGIIHKHQDETGKKLQAEFNKRREDGIRDMVKTMQGEGATPDQIVAQLLEESLIEHSEHNQALESTRKGDRYFAVAKWTAAVAGGAVLATLSGLSALRQAKRIAGLGQDIAGHTIKAGVRTAVAVSPKVSDAACA